MNVTVVSNLKANRYRLAKEEPQPIFFRSKDQSCITLKTKLLDMKWFCIVGLLELSGCVHIHLCVDFSLFKVHDARCNTSNFKIASIVRSFSRFLLGTCFDECCLMFTIISARGSHYGSKYGPIKKDNMAKARVPDLVQTAHSELFLYIKH